jgi:iron complex transport system substrate-binding protein
VCAVSLKDLEEAIKLFTGKLNPTVVSLEPNGLEDIWADIRRVARALDAERQAKKLLENLQERIEKIANNVSQVTVRPTVVCIEWIEPLMAAGNWVPTLVKLAGGVDLLGKENEHAPWITWEELQETNPDIIITMPCGYDIEKTRHEISALTSNPHWADLGAVKSGRVYFTDGNQYFNRPGPRLVESLEILAEIFYPEKFQFDHKGAGWIQV